jgi:hypothetical protein
LGEENIWKTGKWRNGNEGGGIVRKYWGELEGEVYWREMGK